MSRRVTVEFLGEDKSLGGTIDGIERSSSKLGGVFKKMGLAAATGFALVGAAAIKGGVDAIGKASDLNETLSKSSAIFGDNAAAMDKWAKGAARSAGLSRQAALEAAAGFGDMFSQIGFASDEAAKMSKDVVQMSADLGSFNNLDTADVADRMSAAFRGEYDSLQAVIPNINAARVESEALAKTGKKTAKELTAQEKAAAVLAIVHKDGSRAMGDFKKTSGGLANQQKILRAQFENLQGAIGQKLLPVAILLVTWFNDKAMPAMRRFGSYLQTVLPPIFEKVKAVVSRVMGSMQGDVGGRFAQIKQIFTDAVSIIQSLWNSFGSNILQHLKSTFENIKKVLSGAFDVIRGIFATVSALLKGDWSGVWDGIKLILSGAVKIVIGMVGQLWSTVRFAFQNAGVVLKAVMSKIWDGIKALVSAGANGVVNAVKAIPGKLLGLGKLFANAGRSLLQGFINGMKNAAGIITGIAGNVWNAVKGLLNGAIDKINAALEFKINVLGKDVGINPPNIKHLARGVSSFGGGVAELGEHGRELAALPGGSRVYPAHRTEAMFASARRGAAAGGGAPIIVNINGALDPVAVGKQVEKALIQLSRSLGRPIQVQTL